jgi:hypothetical protein
MPAAGEGRSNLRCQAVVSQSSLERQVAVAARLSPRTLTVGHPSGAVQVGTRLGARPVPSKEWRPVPPFAGETVEDGHHHDPGRRHQTRVLGVRAASIRTGSRWPLISETEVAGQVASPAPIGAISPTIGLHGTTNTSRCSGLDVAAPFRVIGRSVRRNLGKRSRSPARGRVSWLPVFLGHLHRQHCRAGVAFASRRP